MGDMRIACSILVRKPEGKRPLGRLRRRWDDNIRMELREIVLEDVEWIHLAQDTDTVLNIRDQKKVKFLGLFVSYLVIKQD
jgi:hypothetical protein